MSFSFTFVLVWWIVLFYRFVEEDRMDKVMADSYFLGKGDNDFWMRE